MSVRSTVNTGAAQRGMHPLRVEIEAMRAAQIDADERVDTGAELTLDELNETERSAATIGVSPDAWKPISFMNTAHYSTLLKKNVLDGRLTQQIESFKLVAGS